MFTTFLQQGFTHILDPGGIDHILFLLAICAIYSIRDWKQIIWIVTSFTFAHSLTLLFSVMGWVIIAAPVIEFLIACTIVFTCIENLWLPQLHAYRVTFSAFFGLIHGLGFSNQLKSLFMGMDFNVLETLLPFNLGLELGQMVIISSCLVLIFLLNKIKYLNPRAINYLVSVPVLIQAIVWIFERNIFRS